jgi:hypothetical protein
MGIRHGKTRVKSSVAMPVMPAVRRLRQEDSGLRPD